MDERVIYELGLSVRSLGLWTGSQSGAAAPGVATVSWMGAGVYRMVARTLLGRFISLPWQGKFVIQSRSREQLFYEWIVKIFVNDCYLHNFVKPTCLLSPNVHNSCNHGTPEKAGGCNSRMEGS